MLRRQLFRPTHPLRNRAFPQNAFGRAAGLSFLPEPIIIAFAIGALAGLRLAAGEKSLGFNGPTLT